VGGAYVGLDTIFRSGVPNQACVGREGTTSIDKTNNNETLICRANPTGGGPKLTRLRDITSNLSFVSATEQTEGGVVPKAACTGGGTPIIQLIPKVYATPNGGVAFYAVDGGASWTVRLRSGGDAALVGTRIAVAQVFCYFP
jgi:hypothetical protein